MPGAFAASSVIGKPVAGGCRLAAGAFDRTFRDAQRLLGKVVFAPGGETLRQQRLLPLEGGRGLRQLRFRRRQVGLGRAQIRLLLLLVQPGDDLVLRDMLADLDQPLGDAAADAEGEVAEVARGDLAGERGPRRIVGDGNRGRAHLDRQPLRRRLLALAAGKRGDQRGHDQHDSRRPVPVRRLCSWSPQPLIEPRS